jgi:hypothetical protein
MHLAQVKRSQVRKHIEEEWVVMKIYYKSYFRGLIEITEAQKDNLIKHMDNGITALSGIEKQNYISSRFIIK